MAPSKKSWELEFGEGTKNLPPSQFGVDTKIGHHLNQKNYFQGSLGKLNYCSTCNTKMLKTEKEKT